MTKHATCHQCDGWHRIGRACPPPIAPDPDVDRLLAARWAQLDRQLLEVARRRIAA